MDEVVCAGYSLLISKDEMEAVIAADGKGAEISFDTVQKTLEEYGIRYGLEEIQDKFPLSNTKPERKERKNVS